MAETNSVKKRSAFLVGLLGTDTELTFFNKNKPNKYYPKGETLSFIAGLVYSERPPAEVAKDVPYQTEKVTVVNGPTTMGTEVGERINKGVFSILEAMSRGEDTFNIIAHSRGAVESILVAHEVERIQKAKDQIDSLLAKIKTIEEEILKLEQANGSSILIDSQSFTNLGQSANLDNLKAIEKKREELNQLQQSLIQLVTNSPCKLTKKAMEDMAGEFKKLNFNKISEKLPAAKINIFAIDPVPGGRYLGAPVEWYDERFYHVPGIVKEFTEFVYENERSRCFKAIIPVADSPETKFEYISIPGHHGTGSGNFNDQQNNPVPNNGQTHHVQELLILKILHFLKRNHVIFKSPEDITGHDDLIALVSPFLGESPSLEKEFQAKFLAIYDEIAKNKDAYKHFDKTSYAYLGQEQSFQYYLSFVWPIINARIVHYQQHKDAFLQHLIPPLPGELLLNSEHARLMLFSRLKIEESAALQDMIKECTDTLVNACKDIHSPKPNQSQQAKDIAALMATEAGRKLILEGLGILIDLVSQNYLQGKLDEKAQWEVFLSIKDSFKHFQDAANEANEPHKGALENFHATLKAGLKDTINKHHTNLLNLTSSLTLQLQKTYFAKTLLTNLQSLYDSCLPESQENDYADGLKKQLVNLINQSTNQDIDEFGILQAILSFKQNLSFSDQVLNSIDLFYKKYDLADMDITSYAFKAKEQLVKLIKDLREENSPSEILDMINQFKENLDLEESDAEKIAKLLDNVAALAPIEQFSKLTLKDKEQNEAVISILKQLISDASVELYETSKQTPEEKIKSCEMAYLNLDQFSKALNQFKKIESDSDYPTMQKEITFRKESLLNATEKFIANSDMKVADVKKIIGKEFAELVCPFAILKESHQALQKEKEALKKEQEKFLKTIEEQKIQNTALKLVIDNHKNQISRLKVDLHEQQETNKNKFVEIQGQVATNKDLEQINLSLLNKVQSLAHRIQQDSTQQQEMETRINTQQQENIRINAEKQELTETLNSSEQARLRHLATITTLEERITATQASLSNLANVHAATVSELENSKDGNLSLQATVDDQRQAIKKAQETISGLVEEYNVAIKDVAVLAANSQQMVTGFKAEIGKVQLDLAAEKVKTGALESELTELKTTKNNLDEQIKTAEESIVILNMPATHQALDAIEKLEKLTQGYFLHLVQEGKKAFPKIELNTSSDIFSLALFNEVKLRLADHPATEKENKLFLKLLVVTDLYSQLTDKNKFLFPIDRLNNFNKALADKEDQLGEHRDSAWGRYFVNAMAILTVIPWLALSIYKKTPCIWRSSGETFFKSCKEEAKDAPVPTVPKFES